jgi:hypothetical protein
VPADNKWFTRVAVAAILSQKLADLDLKFPGVAPEKKAELQEIRKMLLAEVGVRRAQPGPI